MTLTFDLETGAQCSTCRGVHSCQCWWYYNYLLAIHGLLGIGVSVCGATSALSIDRCSNSCFCLVPARPDCYIQHRRSWRCLERQFGLRGVTLLWFRSYLSGRSYHVWFAGGASSTVHLICSVPQGSVLGPRLFIMYSANLADKAVEHDINFHGYADDTQFCVHCRPQEIAANTPKLERCITDMDNWMSANRLKLNMDKTELLCQCWMTPVPLKFTAQQASKHLYLPN